jgi:hypothetical protein
MSRIKVSEEDVAKTLVILQRIENDFKSSLSQYKYYNGASEAKDVAKALNLYYKNGLPNTYRATLILQEMENRFLVVSEEKERKIKADKRKIKVWKILRMKR